MSNKFNFCNAKQKTYNNKTFTTMDKCKKKKSFLNQQKKIKNSSKQVLPYPQINNTNQPNPSPIFSYLKTSQKQ